MGFLNINKTQGLILSIFLVVFLTICNHVIFYLRFDYYPSWEKAEWGYFIGLIMMQVVIIPAGMTLVLAFCSKKLSVEWEDGPAALPNIGHFTLTEFNFGVLWHGLLKENLPNVLRNFGPSSHTVHVDDRRTATAIRANVTLTQMTLWKITTRLVLGWRDTEPHYKISSLGFRVVLVSLFCMYAKGYADATNKSVTNYPHSNPSHQERKIDVTPKSNKVTEQLQSSYTVTSELCEGTHPVIPKPELFTVKRHDTTPTYVRFSNDKRNYFLYRLPDPGTQMRVMTFDKEETCFLLPPERKMYISANTPPMCAVNVNSYVYFFKKKEYFTKTEDKEYTRRSAGGEKSITTTSMGMWGTWRYLHTNWHEADDSQPLFVEGMSNKEASSSSVKGGIICF